MYFCFMWWSRQRWRCVYNPLHGFLPMKFGRKLVAEHVAWTAMHAQCKSLLRLERVAHVSKVADELEHRMTCGCVESMQRAVKQIKATVAQSSHSVCGSRMQFADGSKALTYADNRKAFREYFCKLLDAKCMPFSELIDLERESVHGDTFACEVQDFVATIMSSSELVNAFSGSARNKAVGEDLICGDIFAMSMGVLQDFSPARD